MRIGVRIRGYLLTGIRIRESSRAGIRIQIRIRGYANFDIRSISRTLPEGKGGNVRDLNFHII